MKDKSLSIITKECNNGRASAAAHFLALMFIFLLKTSALLCGFLGLVLLFSACSAPGSDARTQGLSDNAGQDEIMLPPPVLESGYALERAIYERVSHRSFTPGPLTLEGVGQLLWAAQGISVDGVTGAKRTAPSAGATHPLEIYLVAGNVEGLEPGVYRYHYARHSLIKTAGEDRREKLAAAALGQRFIVDAAASIVLAAVYDRTMARYGQRGRRYVYMEVGHSTQNVYLQCGPLGLGAVAVGAFADDRVKALLEIAEAPLMIIPVGPIK